MKIAPAVAVVAALLCLGQTAGVEPDNRKAAEELLILTGAEKTLVDMRDQLGKMMTAQIQSMDVPQNMRDKQAKYQQQLLDTIFEELSFEKLRPAYVDVYSSTFTADELSGLVAFYNGPIGRAYVEKLPAVMKQLMEISQTKMQTLVPRIKKMNDDFAADLKKDTSPR